jgi:hypothetical protein
MVKLMDIKGTIYLDQGWHGFSIAHHVKISYFLTFKMLRGGGFNVTILNYTMTKVVQRDPQT